MVLFRRLLGEVLRARRIEQGRTLRQLCADARVSLALDLARDFGDAVGDLPGLPVPELYVRFLGWVRRTES